MVGKTVDHIPKQHFTGHLMENGNEEDPKTTWRRTVEAELKKMNQTWGTVERMANGEPLLLPYMPAAITGSKYLAQLNILTNLGE